MIQTASVNDRVRPYRVELLPIEPGIDGRTAVALEELYSMGYRLVGSHLVPVQESILSGPNQQMGLAMLAVLERREP